MESPFFTVVIPTHNRSNLLKRAMESVLSQTFEDFEIIVVDDHSADDTALVVGSFSDPRIHYMINKRTKGACGARNTGIFSAKGKWVAFLDDDDVWLPDKLKYQYDSIINANKSVGLVCTDYAIFKNNHIKPLFMKNRLSGWVKNEILYGFSMGCLSSVCVKIDILYKIQGFDELFPSKQDHDLWLRVAELATFCHVPKTLVYMYQEKRSRIGQNLESKLEGSILFRKKYATLIDRNFRLQHRYESNIFTYAFILKKKHLVMKTLPWFLLGIIVDFPHYFFTLRTTFLHIYRRKEQIRSLEWN